MNMKNEKITIEFDDEKLDALNVYLNEKELVLENELVDTVQKLYEKHVPVMVRSFIERDRNKQTLVKKRSKKDESSDGEIL
jgi:hypothetical protein